MEVILVSSEQRLVQGEQITFEIQGLGQRPGDGTYVVSWNVEPAGSLTPASGIFMDGQKIYSVFGAAQPDQPKASFDVQVANDPVTVSAEVRYSQARISPAGADSAFAGAEPVATGQATVSAGGGPAASGGATSGRAASAAAAMTGNPPTTTPPAGPAMGGGAVGGTAAQPPKTPELGPDGRPFVEVTMNRAAILPTASQALWTMIRQSTNALSFQRYQQFMDMVLRGIGQGPADFAAPVPLNPGNLAPGGITRQLPWALPFPGVEPYRQLKAATEVFVMLNCGVPFDRFMNQGKKDTAGNMLLSPAQQWTTLDPPAYQAELWQESRRYNRLVTQNEISNGWSFLLNQGTVADLDLKQPVNTILYLALVRANLPDVRVTLPTHGLDLSPEADLELQHGATNTMGILHQKLINPCFIELLWNYWQEEAGLVQTMNAITWRFQNRRGLGDRDPLAALEIDPLRPLNNFLWGYIQDEEHRLSVVRRAYEYEHAYGLTLLGKAIPEVVPADSRPRFIEALHNLLHLCSVFYKQDDDTTIIADGFPLLNALKEVHLLLTQGASNQYGDLGWTARLEMLMQQWLLARPEFREFLPRRVMVDYPEEWMASVETMKTMQGWSSASVLHFRDLATFGEQIVLSIRFEAWPSVINSQDAANWARYWRSEIQGYIYAYRAATGVDVTERPDATLPALLLRERMRESLPHGGRRRETLPSHEHRRLERPRPVLEIPMASRLEEYDR